MRQWLRKTASDFGWDWVSAAPTGLQRCHDLPQGPAFVPSGIYKPAHFVTLNAANRDFNSIAPLISPVDPDELMAGGSAVIEESSIDIYKDGQTFSTPPIETADWLVNVTISLRSGVSTDAPVLSLSIPELNLRSEKFTFAPLTEIREAQWITAIWRIPDSVPERWYPHNLGKPKLYDLQVDLELGSLVSPQFR